MPLTFLYPDIPRHNTARANSRESIDAGKKQLEGQLKKEHCLGDFVFLCGISCMSDSKLNFHTKGSR